MIHFFQSQLDYIYFFYGLSFVILAAIAFTFGKDKKSIIPWAWLAFFAAVHGVNQFLDLFALSIGDSQIFVIFRLVILIASYLLLLEFCRKGISLLYKIKISRWAYLPFLALAVSGVIFGIIGLNATSRYFIGFPVATLTSWIFFKACRLNTPGAKALGVISVAFACYAVFIGLIVPDAGFLPSNLINREAFFKFFGFPVHLAQSICMLLAAISAWFYSQSIQAKKIQDWQRKKQRFLASPLLIVVLLVLILGGWIFTDSMGRYARKAIVHDSSDEMALVMGHFKSEVIMADEVALAISGSPWITPALKSFNEEALKQANSVLDRYSGAFVISVAYLLNKEGLTIASSNRNLPDSFVGKSYSLRPYFQQAITGNPGHYFAVEVTLGERGYYSSYPIKDSDGTVIGVVVIKKSGDDLGKYFSNLHLGVLIDPHGIIFLSSNPDLLFKSLWPIDRRTEFAIVESRQFGDKPFKSLFAEEVRDGQDVTYLRDNYYVNRKQVNAEGWSVVLFNSGIPIAHYRLFAIVIILILCVLTSIFFVAIKEKESSLTAINAMNALYESLLHASAQVAIIATDAKGLITIFNRGAERMLGYAASEMVGKQTPEIIHLKEEVVAHSKELTEEFGRPVVGFDVFVEYAKYGFYKEEEWTYVRKDGTQVPVNLSVTAQRDDKEKIMGYLGIALDLTERKRLERLKDEFVNTVSHELRTPLTAIKESIGIVLDGSAGEVNDEQKDFLDTAKRNVDRLGRLINNVLDFQKLQAGRVQLKMVPTDINDLVQEVKAVMLPLARNKGLTITIDLGSDLPAVAVDRDKIMQVLTNLMNNGLKFTERGGLTVKTFLYDSNHLCVSVKDTGLGIKKDSMSKLFQSFSQIATDRYRHPGGTGLGLVISKEIVEKHGGKIWADSEFEKGSTFSFTLPLKT